MHLVAGFESQIAAYGAALALSGAARAREVGVSGAAVARRDAERGIHVDPLPGFETPPHVLAALDQVIESESISVTLRPGQTVLIVSSSTAEDAFASLVDAAALDAHGVLWVTILALDRGESER